MSSEERDNHQEGSCCSLCGSVSDEQSSSSSATSSSSLTSTTTSNCSETEGLLQWIKDNCDKNGSLFYLKALNSELDDESVSIGKESLHVEHQLSNTNKDTPFEKMQRNRSSYSRLTSWMRSKSKRMKRSVKNASANGSRRKSSQKEEEDNYLDPSFSSSSSIPKIQVSKSDDNYLLRLLQKESNDTLKKHQYNDFFALLYLKHPSDNSDSNDCLVYSFPEASDQQKETNVIAKLKGMFSTLSHVVNDITGQLPVVSQIETHTSDSESVDGDRQYYTAFAHEFNSILVMAVSQLHFAEKEAKVLLDSIVTFVRFLYNSLDAGFKSGSHVEDITSLLNILCYHLFSGDEFPERQICFYFNTVQKLMIDDELALDIDEIINEYESMDWLSDECSLDSTTIGTANDFLVIGTALFYKSHLITSHLAGNYLSDIVCYVKFKGILSLLKQHALKLVVWSEVYPTSEKKSNESLSDEYHENEGSRYFMLLVAVEHSLFCVLLELPFIAVNRSLEPNYEIISKTIKFVVSSINRSGVLEELELMMEKQSKMFGSTFFLASDKLSKKSYKSLSIKDIFQASTKSDEFLSTRSLFHTHHLTSKASKSQSTPSLEASLSTRTTESSASSLDQSSSSQTVSNTFTSTESHCAQSNPSYLKSYIENMKQWFPYNLIIFLDVDHKSNTFFAPILDEKVNLNENEFMKKFRESCVQLSTQLTQYYPSISEIGTQFTAKQYSSGYRVKPKRSQQQTEFIYWLIARRQTADREIFACFQCSDYSGKEIALNFDVHSFSVSLNLHNKLR